MMGDMDKMKSIPDSEIQKMASEIPPEALDVLKRPAWNANEDEMSFLHLSFSFERE